MALCSVEVRTARTHSKLIYQSPRIAVFPFLFITTKLTNKTTWFITRPSLGVAQASVAHRVPVVCPPSVRPSIHRVGPTADFLEIGKSQKSLI